MKPASRLRTEPDFLQTDIATSVSFVAAHQAARSTRRLSTFQKGNGDILQHLRCRIKHFFFFLLFHHHKEPCTHFSCFQNKLEFWPVADGEQHDTLAEITQYKRSDNKTEQRRSQESVHLSRLFLRLHFFLALVCVHI